MRAQLSSPADGSVSTQGCVSFLDISMNYDVMKNVVSGSVSEGATYTYTS
jgi:hypothetical protein